MIGATSPGGTLRRLAGLLVLVAFGLALWASPASAHASLQSTSPAEGEVVEEPPKEIVLVFDESVSGSSTSLRLFDPSGEEVKGLKDRTVDATLSARVPELAEEGSYTVSWNIVSADGHPLGGTYLFHYGEKTLSKPVVEATGTSTPFGAGVLRVVGALALFGALTFVAGPWWFGRRRVTDRRPWLVALVGSLLLMAGGTWVAGSLGVFLGTNTGVAVLVVVGLCVIGTAAAPTAAGPPIATVALVAAALPGHAVSLAPVPLSATFTAIHMLCAAAWITTLFQLERISRMDDPARLRAEVVRRSPVLMGAVALLAGTGLYLGIDRVGWTTLLDSTYGKLLAIKLGLLIVAVALAAYHRYALAPLLPASPVPVALSADVSTDPAVQRFRVGLRLEIVVVAAAVVVAALLGQFSPVAAGENIQGGPYTQRVDAGAGIQAELSVTPGTRGRNDLHLFLFDANGDQATDIDNLQLTLSEPSRGIEDIVPELVEVTDSHAIAQNVQVPFAGNWTIELTGSKGQFDPIQATWQVPVGS